jgi:hypothetical protein
MNWRVKQENNLGVELVLKSKVRVCLLVRQKRIQDGFFFKIKDHDALGCKKEHQGGLVCARGSKLEFWLT